MHTRCCFGGGKQVEVAPCDGHLGHLSALVWEEGSRSAAARYASPAMAGAANQAMEEASTFSATRGCRASARVWHCQSLAVSPSKPPSRSAELAAVDLVLPLEVVHVGRGEVEHDVVHSSASTRSSGSGPNLMFGLGNLSRCQTGITLGSVSSGAIIVSRNSIRRTLYLTRTEMNTGSFFVPCTNRDSVLYIKCSYLYTMSYYEKKTKGAAELASVLRHVRHARHGPERACHDAASGSGDGRLGHGGAGRAESLRQACGGLCASNMGRPVRLRQAQGR
jgi:hypothetical protein